MSQGNDATPTGEVDLVELLGKLIVRKWSIIFITVMVSLIGVIFAFLSAPIFEADALIQLEEKSGSSLALSSELSGLLSEETQSVTEIEIIRSRMVLGEVVEILHLDQIAGPRFLPVIGSFLTRYRIPDPEWGILEPYAWSGEHIQLGQVQMPDRNIGTPFTVTNRGNGTFSVEYEGQVINGVVGETAQSADGQFMLLISALSGQVGREFFVRKIDRERAIQSLRNNLSVVERGKSSSILQVTFTDRNPDRAQAILQAITETYQLHPTVQ